MTSTEADIRHVGLDHQPYIHTSELQATQLECDEAIAILYDVHEGVESVGGENEEVPTGDTPPPPQHQVSTQVLL